MQIDKYVREILKTRGKTVPKREIYGLIEEAKKKLIEKKTMANMKAWKESTKRESFSDRIWRWLR